MRTVLAPENATSASRYSQPLFSKHQSRCSVNLTVEMEARSGVTPFWCKPSIISYVNIRTLGWSKLNLLFSNRLAVVCYATRPYGIEVGSGLAWMQTLLLFRTEMQTKGSKTAWRKEREQQIKICFVTSISCLVVVVTQSPKMLKKKNIIGSLGLILSTRKFSFYFRAP